MSRTTTIGQICRVITGKLDANASSQNGAYPFFTCSINPLRIDTFAYDLECVLIAGNGDLNVKYYKGKFNAYQRTYIVSLKDGVNDVSVKFLHAFFLLYVDVLRKKSVGSTIKYIRLGDITEAAIVIPSLSEQQRFVDILDQEFAKIDALKANAEKSLQNAKDLFQAALKKELEPKKGWFAAQLKDIATIRPPKKEVNTLPMDLPVSFLPMEDLGIMDFGITCTKTKTLGELVGSYTYFAEGDVLLAKVTPCFENGKQGIARHLSNGIGFGSSEYIVYRPGKQVYAEFLYYFLATKEFHDKGRKQMHGACGLKRLSKEIAEQSIISFPDIEEQKAISMRIRETERLSLKLQENYQKTLTLCDDLKQALLRKAFNGAL